MSVSIITEEVRDAAESIIGNLDEDGYLSASLEEIATIGEHTPEQVEQALAGGAVARPGGRGCAQPARVPAAADRKRQRAGGVAWQIVSNHLRLMETRQYKEIAKVLARPHGAHRDRRAHDPAPQSAPRAALFRAPARAWWSRTSIFTKDGDDYIIQMNDEDVPQLRLNAQYRRMLDRDNGATKEVRDYVRERYTSAIQLMKNIEQRKQTILKVCQAIVRRQTEFLSHGLD